MILNVTGPSLQCPVMDLGAAAPRSVESGEAHLLPEPTINPGMFGDAALALANLLIDNAASQHESATLRRHIAEDVQLSAGQAEVAQLNEQADLALWKGVASGLCSIGSGTMHVLETEGKKAFQPLAKGCAALFEGAEKGSGGAFGMEEYDSKKREKLAGQAGDRARRDIEDAREAARSATDQSAKILEFMREYVDTKRQINLSSMQKG